MSNKEWPAKDYVVGSFIQAIISDRYTEHLHLKPDAAVLDIGCGNGAYSKKILEKIPQGKFTGIDASQNMLEIARETLADYSNVILQENDVTQMRFVNEFDCIVSFWCLQWVPDIVLAFKNMFQALKSDGKILTIFSMGDDPYINMFREVKESGLFPELDNFNVPIDYSQFDGLDKRLDLIPFKSFELKVCQESVELPSLDVFRKFIHGISFYQGQIPDDKIYEINEAMVTAFDTLCQREYGGKYLFKMHLHVAIAVK